MEHGDIVLRLLVPTNEDTAEAIHPTVRPLDYPAAGLVARAALDRLRLVRALGNVRRKAEFRHDLLRFCVVVPVIQAQALRRLGGWLGALYRNTLEGLADQLHIGAFGPVHRQPDRHALALDQQAALDAL